jgi:hypothetical protein
MADSLPAAHGGLIAAETPIGREPGALTLGPLGEALADHTGEVLQRVSARASLGGAPLGTFARSSLARVCVLGTAALARWIAADSSERSLAPDGEARALLQEIAARSSASLCDVSERCRQWHAAVVEVLGEQAALLGVPQPALAKAVSMAGTALAGMLAGVYEAFGEEAMVPRAAPSGPKTSTGLDGRPVSDRLPAAPRRRAAGARPRRVSSHS